MKTSELQSPSQYAARYLDEAHRLLAYAANELRDQARPDYLKKIRQAQELINQAIDIEAPDLPEQARWFRDG